MIIDGHSHAIGTFADITSLKKLMKELAVDKIVLCPGGGAPDSKHIVPKYKENFFTTRYRQSHSDRDLGNFYVRSLVEQLPDKLLQFYWINFLDKEYKEKLTKANKDWKLSGLKLHQCVVPFTNDSEDMKFIATFAAKNNLPIFIHIFSPKEARKLAELARRNPKTNFIVAHMMGFEDILKVGKDLTNVYFDISTYYIISRKRIKKAIKYYGSDHVLLGSDSPLGIDNLKNNILKIRDMDLSEEDRKNILGLSIAKLLGLV
ncbi:MAG: amidohydrolase family protein [Candidatus Heimdallarchaeota archaeon]